MYGPASPTSASALGDAFDIWVVGTGKVTWRPYGDVTFTDMGVTEHLKDAGRVTNDVETAGRSESDAISTWSDCARIIVVYQT